MKCRTKHSNYYQCVLPGYDGLMLTGLLSVSPVTNGNVLIAKKGWLTIGKSEYDTVWLSGLVKRECGLSLSPVPSSQPKLRLYCFPSCGTIFVCPSNGQEGLGTTPRLSNYILKGTGLHTSTSLVFANAPDASKMWLTAQALAIKP